MGSKACMNSLCEASSSPEWKKGWPLRFGESASLYDKCSWNADCSLSFCCQNCFLLPNRAIHDRNFLSSLDENFVFPQ
ncbi:hypothetical protein NMG60_11017279 [Bertholletia excelsa]